MTEEKRLAYNARMRDYGKKNRQKIITNPKTRWNKIVFRAKERGLELGITFEQWKDLVIDKKCHYCGLEVAKSGVGLDRKDSNLGYIIGNVVPCCTSCNRIKTDILSYDEMKFIIPLLVQFRKEKV